MGANCPVSTTVPNVCGGFLPPGVQQGTPQWQAAVKTTMQLFSLEEVNEFRQATKTAYLRGVAGNRMWEGNGIKVARYDIVTLRTEFMFWCDVKCYLERFGTTNHPIIHRNVIALDY